MSLITLVPEHNAVYTEAPMTTCPYETSETGTRNYCAASVMTVATNSYQKRNYCWTDNYDCCPLFLSKVMRKR